MADQTLVLETSLADCKLVFRTLHAHLAEHLELMDSTLFAQLQEQLQAAAKADGVDVTDHAAWDAWLGNQDVPSCEERMKKRQSLN